MKTFLSNQEKQERLRELSIAQELALTEGDYEEAECIEIEINEISFNS
jgi:hypothetical protein